MNTKPVSKEEFDKLTPGERRVAIARDVIAQLNINRYHPSRGNWCILYEKDSFDTVDHYGRRYDLKAGAELQPDISKGSCAVCALGAVFASAVGLYDNYKVTTSSTRGQFDFNNVALLLKDYFDRITMMAIEIAFEVGDGWYRWAPESAESDELGAEEISDNRISTLGQAEHCECRENFNAEETANLFDQAWFLGNSYDLDDRARLVAIMENLIRNHGDFVP